MDRSAPAGKRRQDAPQPSTKPPIRIARDKSVKRPISSGRIKSAKDSSEFIRVPRKAEVRDLGSPDEGGRHFVANISRNGALELKPSRMQPPAFTRPPATPPTTSDGQEVRSNAFAAGQRESNMSGTWTPPPQLPRGTAYDHRVPMPPLSMANTHQRRRTRSASFSTVNTVRRDTVDSVDFQLLLNGQDTSGRPKSSIDMSSGLIDMKIPHYRIGTPRFSERGTAYLHNSMYTMASTADDMRSSVYSRAEYDKLFPAPPGRDRGQGAWLPRNSSPYLHPSTAASLTPPRLTPSPSANAKTPPAITPALYDNISNGLNEPSQVRYSTSTGRIVAATIGRLVTQITSPLFLDYELLADFFLTFRTFVSPYECLDYLMARMQWALANDNDAGRIVRVRTFVALRHWILNYFSDDFVSDFSLRQQLCRSVNDLARTLRQRQDQGGSDINVIGELKKCWRRTCAMFWPITDGLETSPDLDITPGEEQPASQFGASTTSLPLTVRRNGSRLDFRRSSQIQILVPPENLLDEKAIEASKSVTEPDYSHTRTRTASIPTSPMSEQSLEVLSCSVPFLRYVKPMKAIAGAPRPAGPQRNPPLSGSSRPVNHAHKRSGSFSDALRDKRPPLPSGRPQSVDLSSLRSYTFTGGLVRGLLLQPSPSKVDLLIPLSPSLSVQDAKADALEGTYFQDHYQQNAGAKKIVRDVRRALSSRKDRHDSPASSHRSTNSSDSRLSGPPPLGERQGGPSAWQQLRGPPRSDMLGERLEASYKEVFEDTYGSATVDPEATEVATQNQASEYEPKRVSEAPRNPGLDRMNSHITTGSRSIVIVDDTGIPEMPKIGRALPSVSTWDGMAVDPLFYEQRQTQDIELSDYQAQSLSTKVGARDSEQRRISDSAIHDLLGPPQTDSMKTGGISVSQARKSSSVHPSGFDMPPIRNQLRRRPGGDLKAADHVHDLEPEPRPYTGGSFSTLSYSINNSQVPSSELSGTHFSGQALSGFRFPKAGPRDIKNDSLGLLQSQPDVRPSMERQMSQLAKLPDEYDDGGIENALAKLEGKASSPAMLESKNKDREIDSGVPSLERQKPKSQPLRLSDAPVHNRPISMTADNFILSPQTDRQGASIYGMSESDALSEFDPTSIRDSEIAASRQPHFNPAQMMARKDTEQSESTMMFMDKASEADQPAPPSPESKRDTAPTSAPSQGSFLLDDNESLSEISTEIAEQSGDDSLGVRSFFFDDTIDDEPSSIVPFNPPPTPPSTVGAARNYSPERKPMPKDLLMHKQRALKEAASAPKLLSSNNPDPAFHVPKKELRRAATQPANTMKAHLPFVLAFESDVIAEQLTIIEKDAIDEVDWKDLITLNWQQQPSHARNWVDFLQKGDVNGIDIVIARFNLVVKWVVSECVLTESASERAKCITKYIHIAAHAHRLRNYASTYQITLALLSADLARLQKTWALVPAPEKLTLARFEKLCQPVRNFHTLRTEMEAITAEASCIPFIGLYTHDLMFNAQKPARIEPTPPSKEPLVNFERFQTAATIVKSLLRLIETSSNYIFHPHPEVLSRCLWLAALEDSEIVERCRGLD